jgi:hypothetical protein
VKPIAADSSLDSASLLAVTQASPSPYKKSVYTHSRSEQIARQHNKNEENITLRWGGERVLMAV